MLASPKIIIVGAGASGIAAATRLLDNGITDITILEAENRIGGRVNSVQFGGSIVDLGGQWCHGEEGNVVYEMVKDLDVLATSHNNYQDNTFYLSNGTVLDKCVTDGLFKIAGSVYEDEETARTYKGTYGDFFIKEYKQRVTNKFKDNKEAIKIADILIEWFHKFFNGLDATKSWFDVSITGPFRYKSCDGDLQWNWKCKGYETILYVLMKKFPDISKQLPIDDKIFLNKKVTRVVWDCNSVNSGGVTVDCADGSSYNADHVIITVSLGVLKALSLNFEPEMPPLKQEAIRSMAIGTVNKILLKFPTKWWPDDLKGFSLTWTKTDSENLLKEFPHGPSEDGRSWLEDIYGFYVIDSHPRVLLGWVVGKMAEQVELLSDEIVIKGCLFLLRKFAGHKYNITEPDAVLRSKWKSNPHFCGSYSYCSREAENSNISADDLAAPLVSSSSKQVVLFAGEATHPCYFSTVHGAIETGYREADRLLNIYKSRQGAHYKVAIIGAGMAGLGAAKALVEMGCNDIIILEAQDKPGGRIHTLEWENHVLELGAQWIHGKENPLFELADKHGLLSDQRSEEGLGIYIRENGEIIDELLVKAVDFEVGKILSECENFLNLPDYPSSVGEFVEKRFWEYLNRCGDSAEVKEIKLELFDWHVRFQLIDNSCLDLYELSAKDWGKYVCFEDAAHVNLKTGYGSLVQILIDSLPKNTVTFSNGVSEIKYGTKSSDPVKLTCQNGSVIWCDHVIITASLGILKDHLKITPPLPSEITRSIRDVGFHGIGKIFLIFDYKWWDFEGLQLIWRNNTALEGEDKWTRYVQGFDPVLNAPNVLLGWVGGRGVGIMESLSEEDVGAHCMKLIRRFVRHRQVPDPIKVIRSRWLSNPWVRGGYCHITTACDRSGLGIDKLAEPVFVDGKMRILLAGEAIHPSHFSTTHGAYESGQQQARILCEYLTRNCKL